MYGGIDDNEASPLDLDLSSRDGADVAPPGPGA
jgi:hypothetical protein